MRLIDVEPHTLAFLGEVFRRHRRLLAVALVASLAAAAFEGSTIGVLALALESLSAGPETPRSTALTWVADAAGAVGLPADGGGVFLTLLLVAVVAQILRGALRLTSDSAAAHLQSRAEGESRRQIIRQLLAISFAEARRHRTGDLASHMEQANYLGLLLLRLNDLLGQALLVLTYLVALCWLLWSGTLVAAVGILAISLILRGLMRRIRLRGRELKDALVGIVDQTVEYLNGLRLLHSMGREEYALARIERPIRASVEARRKGLILHAMVTPIVESLSILGIGAALGFAYFLYANEQRDTLIRLATFLFVLYRLAPRLSAVHKTWGLVGNYLPFVDRIASLLRTDDKEYPVDGDLVFPGLERRIELQGVWFSHPTSPGWVLEDVSFTIEKGQTVAIVGESGAGKSTVVDLLLRLYSPSRGCILVDGVDLARFRWSSWRDAVGIVDQETFLLDTSIAENLTLGAQPTDSRRLAEAAALAQADSFIADLPQGFATTVGDRGHRLSGGQRQRLAIARALLRQPEVLILDEATSDLDSRAERAILEEIARLDGRRTVIAIAHRLSTVAHADLILVLRRGRIVERGRHDELLRQEGLYAQLWALQASHRPPVASVEG